MLVIGICVSCGAPVYALDRCQRCGARFDVRRALRRAFWRGFWDGFTLGPLWRWLARRS